jgi:hypothetical protein
MKRFGIIVFGLVLAFGQPAYGQSQTEPSYMPDTPDQSYFDFRFALGSGIQAPWGGIQVGPYVGNVGHAIGGPAFTLYCVDYANVIWSGYQATALVSNIGGGNMDGTRLIEDHGMSNADALVKYQQSAYLASLYFSNMGNWAGIQAAIWTIMTPGFAYSSYANDGTDWLAVAQSADLGGFNFGEWNVLTPYDDRGIIPRQEMLAQTSLPSVTGEIPPTVTPEPETYVLLLSGLIFLAVFGRRRMKEVGYI